MCPRQFQPPYLKWNAAAPNGVASQERPQVHTGPEMETVSRLEVVIAPGVLIVNFLAFNARTLWII